MGVKILKRYSSYKLQPKVLKLKTCPEFSSQWSSQRWVETFWLLMIFSFENSQYTIVPYTEKTKTSTIWKKSYCRAKRSEMWDSDAAVQHIWVIFDLVAFKVIWGHSVVLRFFWKYGFHNAASSTLIIHSNLWYVLLVADHTKVNFLAFVCEEYLWNLRTLKTINFF